MSHRTKLFLGLAFAALVFAAVPAAQAQIDCNYCDPANSFCDESCYYCIGYTQDGCADYGYSTCGEEIGACLTCSPTWSETSRQYRGSYGNGDFHWTYWECTHHVVEWVTLTDTSHCNTSSSYWTMSYCDDSIDHSESGVGYQDCCDGGWYCDGHHSC
ncbi:MAG TPA: hypothetical protein VJ276_02140 [Thermoanaerobaculia bacterium]|nr:hypothetical protein [Thermoanaerobaculia bacterium]